MNAAPMYVALSLVSLASTVCLAQASGDLVGCTQVADDKNRLKCYDEHMARAGYPVAAPSTKTAPPPKTAAAPKPASSSTVPDDFGLDPGVVRKKRAAESPAEPAELVGRVKSVSTRAHGEYSIEMDNGQVWVETLRTGGQPPAVGETVTIKPGALGAFYLTRTAGTALRVKRIK
jgi:hypothetical protein